MGTGQPGMQAAVQSYVQAARLPPVDQAISGEVRTGTWQSRLSALAPPHQEDAPNASVEHSVEYDPSARPTNPGSLGHPELCPRPCLYFTAGACANGRGCEFCHWPHPKRPAHLDKRRREILKAMTFPQIIEIMCPILMSKVESL